MGDNCIVTGYALNKTVHEVLPKVCSQKHFGLERFVDGTFDPFLFEKKIPIPFDRMSSIPGSWKVISENKMSCELKRKELYGCKRRQKLCSRPI